MEYRILDLEAEIDRLKALVVQAYEEGFSDGAYCFDESANPEKYVAQHRENSYSIKEV